MTQRPHNVFATIRRVLGIGWNVAPGSLVIYLAASVFSAASLGLAVLVLRQLITGTLHANLSWRTGTEFILLLLIQVVCTTITAREAILLRFKISTKLNKDIQAVLPNVPYPRFEDTAFQAEYGMLVREASFKPATMIDSILQSALGTFSMLAILIVLLPIMPTAGLILLALLVPVMLTERRLRGQMLLMQTSHAPDLLRLQYISQSSIDPDWQRDLRAYGSDVLNREYALLSERYLSSLSAVTRRIHLSRFFTGLASLAIFVILFVVVAQAVARHSLTASDAITLVTGGYYLASRIGFVSMNIGSILESTDFMSKAFSFIDGNAREGEATRTATEPVRPRLIHVCGVNYSYPRASTPALRGIDVSIRQGITGIIGANGAGKSTFVKILAGLLPPDAGEVEVLDDAGATLKLAEFRIAVLFQNPAQLRLTIRQNVTMRASSPPEADRKVWEALHRVGVADVVRALPDGLDSWLGGGFGGRTNLSGGQWQRLGLARALYHDAQIVLLDEPSSHLDAPAETRLLHLLTEGFRDRIVVVVTHRRKTLQICDRYLELADGTVASEGTVASSMSAVAHPYLDRLQGEARDHPEAFSGADIVDNFPYMYHICSFCGRDMRVPRAAGTGQPEPGPDQAVCLACAALSMEILNEENPPDGAHLQCSFCGDEQSQTVPGPDYISICMKCARRWLDMAET